MHDLDYCHRDNIVAVAIRLRNTGIADHEFHSMAIDIQIASEAEKQRFAVDYCKSIDLEEAKDLKRLGHYPDHGYDRGAPTDDEIENEKLS